jgi:hypothetical protein
MALRFAKTLTWAALVTFGVSASADAGPITFTFDSTSSPTCSGLSATNGPTQIQNYMNCVLGGTYVTSVSSGAVVSKGAGSGTSGTTVASGYTGDGHAVGVTGSNQSLTLGNTNNATLDGSPLTAGPADAFIMNNALANSSYTYFSFQFGNGFTIAAGSTISFDYQIFPDGTCTALTSASCGGSGMPNRPDFKFYINGTQAGTTRLGDTPGTGGTYTDSPASYSTNAELAPQELGVFTYTVGSALVNPLLSFVDWPATIGIDNLKVYTPDAPPPVPEPLTLTLVGLGMAGLRTYRRRTVA